MSGTYSCGGVFVITNRNHDFIDMKSWCHIGLGHIDRLGCTYRTTVAIRTREERRLLHVFKEEFGCENERFSGKTKKANVCNRMGRVIPAPSLFMKFQTSP